MKKAEMVTSEDLKINFAKKGLHAFDIKKNEFAGDNKNKENIKICIRKNNAHNEKNINNLLKEEAEKIGYKVKIFEEKTHNRKK